MIRKLNSLEGVTDTEGFNDYDEPLLDYVYTFSDEFYPPNELDGEYGFYGSKVYSNFVYRYHKGELNKSIPHKKSPDEFVRKFEADKVSLEMISEMGYDIGKFWYLTLLVNDLSYNACLYKRTEDPTPYNIISKFSDLIGENFEIVDKKINLLKDIEIKLSIGGRKKMSITDKDSLALLCICISEGLVNLPEKSKFKTMPPKFLKISDMLSKQTLSFSVRIWYFAKLLKYFIKIEPPIKKKAKRNSCNSNSINYLVSRMVYLYELTNNKSFLDSSDSLVGFFKQYDSKAVDCYLFHYGCEARVDI